MSNPEIVVYSPEDVEQLREYRDAALVESNLEGKRKSLGGLSFGIVEALWRSDEGGGAHLIDQGFRYNGKGHGRASTNLTISEQVGDGKGFIFTVFEMELDGATHDNSKMIEVFKAITADRDLGSMKKINNAKREEGKLGLLEPTKLDIAKLIHELGRGASGLYLTARKKPLA